MTANRILTPMQKMLLDGADYIEKWGHWKGAYFKSPYEQDFDGSVFPPACLMGSLTAARAIEKGKTDVTTYDGEDSLVGMGENYMNHYLGVSDCTAWNDEAARSAAEVIQSLRDAAAAYKDGKWDTSAQEQEQVEEDEHV